MKRLIIVLFLFTLFGCKKSNVDGVSGINIVDGIYFSVFNSQNEDLLDPATESNLDASKIKLFYEIDGKIEEVYNPNYDHPRNYFIYNQDNVYKIGVSLNSIEDTTITYIQWDKNDTDTIRAAFRISNIATIIQKVWLNGKQIWDWHDSGEYTGYYKIIK